MAMNEQLTTENEAVSDYPITIKIWDETNDRTRLVRKLWRVLHKHGVKFRMRDKGTWGGNIYKGKAR